MLLLKAWIAFAPVMDRFSLPPTNIPILTNRLVADEANHRLCSKSTGLSVRIQPFGALGVFSAKPCLPR